jgi:hypothetical protein
LAWTAANSLVTNPIVLEVFNANVTVSDSPITVKKVVFLAAGIADRFALQSNQATDATTEPRPRVVIDMQMSTNTGMEVLDFGDSGFTFPNLYFDTDSINNSLAAGDRILIYLK